MKKKEINTKTNRWGVLMSLTMMFVSSWVILSLVGYPVRQYIVPGVVVGVVVIMLSGLMAWCEVRQLGWPTYEGSARWNTEMKNEAEGGEL